MNGAPGYNSPNPLVMPLLPNSQPPSRRDLLELAVRAAALPAAAQFFPAWLKAAEDHNHGGAQAPPQPPTLQNYKPQFFSAEDFSALQAMTELLIPTDETPGAREAHCAHYIDFVMQASREANPKLQEQWRDAMKALQTAGFHTASGPQRAKLLEAMSLPERDRTAKHALFPAYRLIKTQNTFAFYTARAGMIEALDYRGNSYNVTFPPCEHPEHHTV